MSDAMSNAELLLSGSQPAPGAAQAENVGPRGSAAWRLGFGGSAEGQTDGGAASLGEGMGGGGDGEPSEAEIRSELQKYERNWDNKPEADKDNFLPAWEMVLKARLGSKPAEKWCQDNNLTLELHGEVFRRLAAKRREEKMTTAEKAQGLTAEFLIFREVLPHMLNNKELVDQRTILAPQQGGANVAKP